jgi:hypothetical protein
LLQPEESNHHLQTDRRELHRDTVASSIHRGTGLQSSSHRYEGWLGLDCREIRAAVWIMRVLIVSNVLSRREGSVVFVPLNRSTDPQGELAVRFLVRAHSLAIARHIF